MKNYMNIANGYILLWCIYYLQGIVYPSGGIVSQSCLALVIALSAYCMLKVNMRYRLPSYMKALNMLVVFFGIYGLLRMLMDEQIYITEGRAMNFVPSYIYLRSIFSSLLPIYAFYYFTRRGWLTARVIATWILAFVVLVTLNYTRFHEQALLLAIENGLTGEEFTNNVGYTFLSLMPLLFFLKKRPLLQYLIFAYILIYVIMSMKRGAIVTAVPCALWFMYRSWRSAPRRTRLWLVVLGVVVSLFTLRYVQDFYEQSDYFQVRLMHTVEGNSSGRDVLYGNIWKYIQTEQTAGEFLVGAGADHAILVAGNYAHNDWLEIAVNQGILGVLIYLVYWVAFYRSWRSLRSNSMEYEVVGMLLMMYLLMTLFSMSYSGMTLYATIGLGYCMARISVIVPHEKNNLLY